MLKGCFTLILISTALVIRAQKLPASEKLSYTLKNALAQANEDSMTLSVSFKQAVNQRTIRLPLQLKNLYGSSFIIARIKRTDLEKLLADSNILFISPVYAAREELTTGAYDLSLNKVNYVHARFPQLSGHSLQVALKERLFDTTDIDLKGRILKTGVEASAETIHASLMATMIVGGANSSPFAKGVAPEAVISSASFSNLFPETDSISLRHKISVENHSYGTAVENFYGNEASAYDRQSNSIPALLHIFSSGNSGTLTTTSGPYAGVSQFANLTGNFKHSKNSIAVGSIDSAGQLMPLSSRGPAHDGRVKPELMAYGEDGSSGAAATVSGTALLVQNAYKKSTMTAYLLLHW